MELEYFDDYDDEVDALWNGQLPMDRVLQTLQNEIESRKAAEKRVTELESQLAAQWRPVTEPPQMVDNYHVWRRPGYHDFCHFDGVNWRTTGGDSVTHWQPLPAPPQDTPASGR